MTTTRDPAVDPPPTPRPDAPGRSRRGLLRAAGAGGAGAAALLLAACGGDDDEPVAAGGMTTTTASGSAGDLKILNYALTLEYLEADFYAKVLEADLLRKAETELAKTFGDSEQQHVDALKATIEKLGGTPVEAPETTFPLESRTQVLELARVVENLGAAAYLGKAGEIKNPEILAAALSIHSVEARHAAALNQLLGKPPTPDGAFAKPADEKAVLAAVKPYIVA
ncbi:MAG: ferritin-like domain-containing protein [Solirubrobacteraceae bacterium]|nr:ferritin-like domain-containing protein [Solirubrobacteraceae bacterium]